MLPKQRKMIRFTTKDAIILAYSNPEFMEALIKAPEEWAEQFNLPEKAFPILRAMDPIQVRQMSELVRDPIAFSEAADVLSQIAKGGDGY